MSEESELIKAAVVVHGDDIGIKEPVCLIWKADHANCEGCPSQLGCSKYVSLMLINLQAEINPVGCDLELLEVAIELIFGSTLLMG